jgi:hypothetical protein
MDALDDDLNDLQYSLSQVNQSFESVDERLNLKFTEIRRLDTMEKDLNKLKYLSELPNMFKKALISFEN